MKTILSFLVLVALGLPAVAQVDHDYNANDRVPFLNEEITKEQVPEAVRAAVNKQFKKNDPLTWSKFPYALKEYGWVYDVGASDIPLDRYEVTMRTTNGSELWAAYTVKGELVETREVLRDVTPPDYILDELAQSKYKEWKIVGNKEIIKFYHDHDLSKVEQHFRLTVQKGNEKRSISFNYKGEK